MIQFPLVAVVMLASLTTVASSFEHVCQHDLLPRIEQFSPQQYIQPPPESQSYKRTAESFPVGWDNIRIVPDYRYLQIAGRPDDGFTCYATGETITLYERSYTCQEGDVLTAEKSAYLQQLVDAAVQKLIRSLGVVPVAGNMTLAQQYCIPNSATVGYNPTPLRIPPQYNAPGHPNTDFLLLAVARPIFSNSTLAQANDCIQDPNFVGNRPVAGYIDFNLRTLDLVEVGTAKYASTLGIATHEITHSLGFSRTRFQSTPNYWTVQTLPSGRNITKIISPTVVAVARDHFGCSTIDGVEVENQGGAGTERSHWEKRILNTEYMIGTSSAFPVLSKFTLAALQDLGTGSWYKGNFSAADTLYWGLKQGCAFVGNGQQQCKQWTTDGYRCEQEGELDCSHDFKAKADCQFRAVADLDPDYQYFPGDPTKAGSDTLSDYCPHFSPLLRTSGQTGWCIDSANNAYTLQDPRDVQLLSEVYSASSRCFVSSLAQGVSSENKQYLACYQTACLTNSTVKVKLGKYWYNCPPGESIKAFDFGGKLACPNNQGILCYGATESTVEWPEFISVQPTSGGPSSKVTITGTGFTANMTIYIPDEEPADCTFVSSTTYECQVASSKNFRNPLHLISDKVSVIMVDQSGRSTVGFEKFTWKVSLGTWLSDTADWMSENPLATAGIAAAVLLGIILCIYCCYRERKRARYGKKKSGRV